MKKMKITLAAIIAALVCCFAFAACAPATEVTVSFGEWETAAEDTCEAGDLYSLETSVKDENGKVWAVDASVTKNSDGAAVKCSSGKILVEDMDGYKIVYTVKVSEKETHTRTVNLKAVDTLAPVVTIEDVTATVDGESSLPEISVIDAGDKNPSLSYKLFKGKGEGKTEIPNAIVNGKFGVTEMSFYTLAVTATDRFNNTVTVEKEFYARHDAAANEILKPDCEAALEQVRTTLFGDGVKCAGYEYSSGDANDESYTGGYIRFFDNRTVEQYEDETLLTQIDPETGEKGWGGKLSISMGVAPRISREQLESFEFIRAWVYYEYQNPTAGERNVKLFSFTGSGSQTVSITPGTWQLIELKMDSLTALLDSNGFAASFFDASDMAFADNSLRAIRVGDVYGFNYANLAVTGDKDEYIAGDVVTLTVSNPQNVEYTLTVLDKDGNDVNFNKDGNTVTFTPDIYGEYFVTASSTDSVVTDNGKPGKFTVRVKGEHTVKVDSFDDTATAGDEIEIPGYALVKTADGSEVTDGEVAVSAKYVYAADETEIEVNGTSFTPSASGTLTVTYKSAKALPETAVITVEKKALAENVLIDGTNRDALAQGWYASGDNEMAVSFVEATGAEEAYTHVEILVSKPNTGWFMYYFRPEQNRDAYKNYNYIKMEVRVNSDAVYFGGNNAPLGTGYHLTNNRWITVYATKENYTDKCKGQNGTVEIFALAPMRANDGYGCITGFDVRTIEGVNEKPLIDADVYNLLDVDNYDDSAAKIVVCDGNTTANVTDKNVSISSVPATGSDPALVRIDYSAITDSTDFINTLYLDLFNLDWEEYGYFKIKLRYNAENTVTQSSGGFEGVAKFDKTNIAGTSTNTWTTYYVTKAELISAARKGWIKLGMVRAFLTRWGNISSVDIAELCGLKESQLPAEITVADYAQGAIGTAIALPSAAVKNIFGGAIAGAPSVSAVAEFKVFDEQNYTAVEMPYTPTVAGTLKITYSADGYDDKEILIEVLRPSQPANVLFAPDRYALTYDWAKTNANVTLSPEVIEADGDVDAYLKLNIAVASGTASDSRSDFTFKPAHTDLSGYNFVKVEFMLETSGLTAITRSSLFGYYFYGSTNTWQTAYIPVDSFTGNLKNGVATLFGNVRLNRGTNAGGTEEYGNVTAIRVASVEAVTKKPQTADRLDLIDVNAANGAETGIAHRETETGKVVSICTVAAAGEDPAYVKVDFSEWSNTNFWTKVYWDAPEDAAWSGYSYIVIKIRYSATRTVSSDPKTEDFGGVGKINSNVSGTSTNTWYTGYVAIGDFWSQSRGNSVLLCSPKVNGGTGNWSHGDINSVDIAELYATNTIPSETNF